MALKIYESREAALDGLLFDGMTIMSGGFGLSGNPESLIPQRGLTVISNNAGADGFGLWMPPESRPVKKMISSYVGEDRLFDGMLGIDHFPYEGEAVSIPSMPASRRSRRCAPRASSPARTAS